MSTDPVSSTLVAILASLACERAGVLLPTELLHRRIVVEASAFRAAP